MRYFTITESTASLVVSRSRFLAFGYPISSEDELSEKLAFLRKTYHDATHVCYAAIWDEKGSYSRFSDDGEPSGTAGAPILEAIKSADLKKCMVAVVRYFGGVKLGTGGLTRAYSSVSVDCLSRAEKIELIMSDIYRCKTDFATFKRLSGMSGIDGVTFSDGVSFMYSCPVGSDIQPLINKANGRLSATLISTEFRQVRGGR